MRIKSKKFLDPGGLRTIFIPSLKKEEKKMPRTSYRGSSTNKSARPSCSMPIGFQLLNILNKFAYTTYLKDVNAGYLSASFLITPSLIFALKKYDTIFF